MTGMEGTARVEELDSSGRFPRLLDSDVESKIARSEYSVYGGRLTVCVLTLMNGFHVVGESSCVDVRNFNEKQGRELARQKAKDRVWMLEGYLLKQRIFESEQIPQRY